MPPAPPLDSPAPASRPLIFIVPELPPAVCGLGDYSMKLVEELRLDPAPHFLLMRGGDATRAFYPEMTAEEIPKDENRLVQRLTELGAERVLMEYVGWGYHSRGCPLWLLRGLRKWKKKNASARLVIMFQELWFRPAWYKPDFLLQHLHRRAIRQLLPVVDQVFVSTEGYAQWLSGSAFPGLLRVLPNASNILPVDPPRSERENRGTFMIFGKQTSRLVSLEEMAPWLRKLYASGRLQRLQIVGMRGSEEQNQREDAAARAALPEGAFEILGAKSPEELSRLFAAAEFGIFTQSPAGLTKSTIFMAFASHGMNIVSPNVTPGLDAPQCWITHPDELLENGAGLELTLAERAAKILAWYEQNLSWPRIADAYRQSLKLTSAPSLAARISA